MSHQPARAAKRGAAAAPAARVLAAALLGLLLAGATRCGGRAEAERDPPAPRMPLVIGLIPEQNIFRQLERYEPLAAYLSDATGTNISLKILPRYGNIIENFRSTGLDGAFFGSFTYALAHEILGVEAVARPVWLDGGSTYYGMIFVRKDSGIRTVADMRGKRFVFVDRATTAGYLLPLHLFASAGISDYSKYLRETYFAGTHEDAIRDVLDGKADIGAAKNTVMERMMKEDDRLGRDLVVLARSPDVPENALALRRDLDPRLAAALRDTLLFMHQDPRGRQVLERFGAKWFIQTTTRDYEPVFRYAREVRLDLVRYGYHND